MKTITNCFLYIAISVVLCSLNIIFLVINLYTHDWWNVAMGAVAVAICVWVIRGCYKQAKDYEEIILEAIDNTLDVATLAYTKALRLETKEMLSKLEELSKDKKDEMEDDNGTPV